MRLPSCRCETNEPCRIPNNSGAVVTTLCAVAGVYGKTRAGLGHPAPRTCMTMNNTLVLVEDIAVRCVERIFVEKHCRSRLCLVIARRFK